MNSDPSSLPTESSQGLSFKQWFCLLVGLCPFCRDVPIYKNFLQLYDLCPHCGADLPKDEVGDGPAFFALSLTGFIVVMGALWLEIAYMPHFIYHVIIWPIVALVLSVATLRIFRILFIYAAQRYQ